MTITAFTSRAAGRLAAAAFSALLVLTTGVAPARADAEVPEFSTMEEGVAFLNGIRADHGYGPIPLSPVASAYLETYWTDYFSHEVQQERLRQFELEHNMTPSYGWISNVHHSYASDVEGFRAILQRQADMPDPGTQPTEHELWMEDMKNAVAIGSFFSVHDLETRSTNGEVMAFVIPTVYAIDPPRIYIAGHHRVGETLTIVPGEWVQGATLSYRWFADGQQIPDQTKATYVVTAQDSGKWISATITGSKPGWLPADYEVQAPEPSPEPAPAFSDVPAGSQFSSEIAWLAEKGISTGWTEANGTKTYRPLQPVNRDAMAAFMYRLAGKPAFSPPATSPFSDVPAGTQFYKEIIWLAKQGISTGWTEANGTKTYRPLQPVNRDAMAAFMYRYNLKTGAN